MPDLGVRGIRSFARRSGRMTDAQLRAWEQLAPERVYAEHDREQVELPWDHPDLVLDIGFGMGQSLAQMAAKAPETLFLGAEVYRPGIGALLLRCQELDLQNVQVLEGDVVAWLAVMPEGVFQRCQVFFPDPWHKKRHHKRRLLTIPLLEKLASVLKVGGLLHIATDWQPYAEEIVSHLQSVPTLELTNNTGYVPKPDWRPSTKYERRGLRLGHTVFDITATKLPPSSD